MLQPFWISNAQVNESQSEAKVQKWNSDAFWLEPCLHQLILNQNIMHSEQFKINIVILQN